MAALQARFPSNYNRLIDLQQLIHYSTKLIRSQQSIKHERLLTHYIHVETLIARKSTTTCKQTNKHQAPVFVLLQSES